jgi:RNase P/RNase MRP subunit POP5
VVGCLCCDACVYFKDVSFQLLIASAIGTIGTMRKWHKVARYFISVTGTIGTMRKWHKVARYFISAIGTIGTMRCCHQNQLRQDSTINISSLSLGDSSIAE